MARTTPRGENMANDDVTSGSVGGAVHRGWMNIKAVVTAKDDRKIIAEHDQVRAMEKSAPR
jgi:broad specificity polyphosphatase/5'/3'-nucleotidase SurE